jgi:hypothetical protein
MNGMPDPIDQQPLLIAFQNMEVSTLSTIASSYGDAAPETPDPVVLPNTITSIDTIITP